MFSIMSIGHFQAASSIVAAISWPATDGSKCRVWPEMLSRISCHKEAEH